MTSAMNTILIIGGTGGIGEAFAKRFHSMGKKVIITGRRADRIDKIKRSTPGIEGYVMDMKVLKDLPSHTQTLFSQYPDIDTVWVNGGIQKATFVKEYTKSTDQDIIDEVTTNSLAPMILARHIIPKFLERKTETNFLITSSGIAYVPSAFCPIYGATKSGIHHYLVALRQQLKDTKINILEIVPPYVATELDANFDADFKAKMPTPMPLEDFTNETFAKLEASKASELKEVAAGTAVNRLGAWRGSIGEMLIQSGAGG